MADVDPDILLGYFPLFGATFDSDGVGFVGGRVAAYIPERERWAVLEERDVGMERALGHLPSGTPGHPYDPEGAIAAPPPPCLVIGAEIPNDRRAARRIAEAIDPMEEEAADAILALRLLKPGWFLDPELSMRAFRYEPWLRSWRRAGAYRQAGLDGLVESTMPAYELRLDDLIREPDDEPEVTSLFGMVRAYREHGRGAAAIPIRNFSHSYGYTLTGTARASLLFIALDAMLGGMSSRQIGRYRPANSFVERLELALRTGPMSLPRRAASTARWADTEGRTLRNAIAHGRPADVADLAEASHERLRAIVRHVLTLYIDFCLQLAEDERPPAGSGAMSPVAEFNAALDAS